MFNIKFLVRLNLIMSPFPLTISLSKVLIGWKFISSPLLGLVFVASAWVDPPRSIDIGDSGVLILKLSPSSVEMMEDAYGHGMAIVKRLTLIYPGEKRKETEGTRCANSGAW